MSRDTNKVAYTTSINADILQRFRVYCAVNNLYQNEVLEKLIVELLKKEGEEVGNTDRS